MNKFTVIGFYEENGQSFCDHVLANNRMQAMYMTASRFTTGTIIAAINGHLNEGVEIDFAGEGVVDSETILEQEDIFNITVSESSLSSIVLADFEIRDWRYHDEGESWDGPTSHRDAYRFVIEQSTSSKAISFNVYSRALDFLNSDQPRSGLAGAIEIRNGKPALSIGTDEENLCLHVESDIHSGLFVHADADVKNKPDYFYSYSHGIAFNATHYSCTDSAWLRNVRSEIAEAEVRRMMKENGHAFHVGFFDVSGDIQSCSLWDGSTTPVQLSNRCAEFCITFYENSIMHTPATLKLIR